MCGIAGIFNLDKRPVDRAILENMVKVQRHRGPDDTGFYFSGDFGLAHARLAIIDLSYDARQPMSNEDETLFIVHNGEIYNYLELREELKRLGHVFKSKSDTEVILHAYEEWAEGCLKHFNGMWAFAILDIKKRELFCSRDRFGVKPFYYYSDGNAFIFASEIKALLYHPKVKRLPNDKAIFDYLYSGYGYMDMSDETFFAGIKQLKPGHWMKIDAKDGKESQTRYWDISSGGKRYFENEEDAYREFYSLFEDAVRLRLRSDVPLGVSLSGGLDSSSIACVTAKLLGEKKLEAFSSCFEEKEYDERRFIEPVLAKTGANANFIFTKPDRLFDEIEDIIWYQEEPYSTLSIFPQWYVMKLARQKGIKVLLTGQGGDEVLGGYHKYYFYLFADLVRRMKLPSLFKEVGLYKNIKGGKEKVINPTAKILLSYATPGTLKVFLKKRLNKKCPAYLNCDFVKTHFHSVSVERKFQSILNNDLYNALKISPLPSLLHIDDRSSMAHSVESRSPFLDYRLVEYLFSLGPEYKIRNGSTKYILRESLKGVLPEAVRTRRDKMGYATPLDKWFKTALEDKVRGLISSKEFSNRPYFDHKNAVKKFDDFTKGKWPGAHNTVWSWVNLELWFRSFFS